MKFPPRHFIIITLVYLAISFLLFQKFGVKIVNDSPRYLDYARNLESGFYAERHDFWYVGYALFILLTRIISENEFTIILIQYFLSYLATMLIYQTSIVLFNHSLKALCASLYYILFLETISWNSYVLCESLYMSLTCASFYCLSSVYRNPSNIRMYLVTVFCIALTFFTKPTGVALLGAVIITLVVMLLKRRNSFILRTAFASISLVSFALLIDKMLTTFLIMENYKLGEVVYAITTLPLKPEYEPLILTPPATLTFPSDHLSPVTKVFLFILYNPIYWIKLFSLKVFYFFIHVRPYWSLSHNIFCLVMLLPMYYFFIQAIIKRFLSNEVLLFSVVYISIHTLSVGITTVDWDGRFLMPLLPLLFLIGSNGMIEYLDRIKWLPLNSTRKPED